MSRTKSSTEEQKEKTGGTSLATRRLRRKERQKFWVRVFGSGICGGG